MSAIRCLLIANRGEIAARIARTARAMGIETVAVHSDADAGAVHVRACDRAVRLGPAPVAQSYLLGETILEAARASGADAIHPGYGFLAENADFAERVGAAGLVWVGPPPAAIRAMGLKDSAKRLMDGAGVPVTPGYHGAEQDPDFLAARAAEIGYPLLIKAVAGGGGKGMRRVEGAGDFADALARARSEAASSFGNDAVLIEKFIESPRHVEVQVFADAAGRAVHLFERDCSAQRRHQKVIEEAPAPGMTPELREAMTGAAVRAAEAVGYVGAGTVEFILDASRMTPDAFFFMEMNTRLQVEHPVTEAVTGIDLVAWQIRVAAGEALPRSQGEIALTGHALEVRLYAEDPARDFFPQTGRIASLALPRAARVDAGVAEGDEVTPHYDPMIAKIVTHGHDRPAALAAMRTALAETHVGGPATNLAFLERLIDAPDFAAARLDTGLIARCMGALTAPAEPKAGDLALTGATLTGLLRPGPLTGWRAWGRGRTHAVLTDGAQDHPVTLYPDGEAGSGVRIEADTPLGPARISALALGGTRWQVRDGDAARTVHLHADAEGVTLARAGARLFHALADPLARAVERGPGGDSIVAPLPGILRTLSVAPGETVAAGAVLAVMEAMKMEHALTAPRDGRVAEVLASPGDSVAEGRVLIALEPSDG